MAGQFEGQTCTLCGTRPSSPTGEHVWPRWLLEMFPADEGPYAWYVNEQPVVKRDGPPRTHASFGAVKLPVCSTCNVILDQRFEKPAKEPFRAIFGGVDRTSLAATNLATIGIWFVKTWLLLAHPSAFYSEPGISPPRWPVDDEWIRWLVNGEEAPQGLSVWAFKQDRELPEANVVLQVPLPTVVADGRTIQFRAARAGLRWLDVSLVYHPGWEIDHPLEHQSRALRLWSAVGQVIELLSLPNVSPTEFAWLAGPTLRFAPGRFSSSQLPPLSSDSNFLEPLPGVEMMSW